MDHSGIEDHFLVKDGKKLQFGYTTGTCAAAAAKAATLLLLTGRLPDRVPIMTPKGIALHLKVLSPMRSDGAASCAVQKYSGDDPDVTNGILIFAEVRRRSDLSIRIDGGVGVGRVTRPGLRLPVGEAAINPVPRQMIHQAVQEALAECDRVTGLDVILSVPEGVEIAQKTFNPRLGIEGGISILGTSGIVEPMSEDAMVDSIALEIHQKRILGQERLVLTPGGYGKDFAKTVFGFEESELVKCSNYIGRSLGLAATEGYREVLLIGHVGKLVKLSGGIMNTHSREGDARAELMAACALRAGASAELARKILDCATTGEMLQLLKEGGLLEKAMEHMGERIDFSLRCRLKDRLLVGVIVFSEDYGILCTTGPAKEWVEERRELKKKQKEKEEPKSEDVKEKEEKGI